MLLQSSTLKAWFMCTLISAQVKYVIYEQFQSYSCQNKVGIYSAFKNFIVVDGRDENASDHFHTSKCLI